LTREFGGQAPLKRIWNRTIPVECTP